MPQLTVMAGGSAVVQCLREQHVEDMFFLSGSCILPILDALYDAADINCVGARHEQNVVQMADGYARVKQKPGVSLVHNGPGLTNTITGVAAAHLAFSPLVVLSGAPMTQHVNRGSIQEVDQVPLMKPVTKWSARVPRIESIPPTIRQAFRAATSGRKGPVHVDLPRDCLIEKLDYEPQTESTATSTASGACGNPILVKTATNLLLNAAKPLIIAGGGVLWANATSTVIQLAETLTAPMATSYGHGDAVPSDHPLSVGQLGRDGSKAARKMASEADVILALGTRLAHFTSYYSREYIPLHARIIQVEIEASEIGKNFPVTVGIHGDAAAVARQILDEVSTRKGGVLQRDAVRLERILAAKEEWRQQRSDMDSDSVPLKPQRVYKEIRAAAPRSAIVVLDDGACCSFGHHLLDFFEPRTFLSPLDLACIGWAYPAALGAKTATPDRSVVAICGDGGFSMSLVELATAVQHNIPIVAVVMNNNCWGAEKAYQKYYFNNRYMGSDLRNPDFAEVARNFGATGFKVEKPGELKSALQEAFKLAVPSLVEVLVDPEELPPPARTDAMPTGRA
ncbi:MAG: thiamine pyrophosphate-binding protein [Candidatus Bathyarchaeia archaeon]